jgi:hypothetical protein
MCGYLTEVNIEHNIEYHLTKLHIVLVRSNTLRYVRFRVDANDVFQYTGQFYEQFKIRVNKQQNDG